MKRLSCCRLALLLFLLIPTGAVGQDVYEIDPIVVTAERIPQRLRDALSSITVVTRSEIEASQAEDLAEVLRLIPGVDVQQNGSFGNFTQVRVRGAEANHLLFLINGVEVNDPFFGGFDLAHIPAAQVERVEVVRGTQTTLYGADAVAGVVNVILKEGKGEGRVHVRGEMGGYGLRSLSGGLSGGRSRLGYSIEVSHFRYGGLNPRDAYRNTAASAKATIAAGGDRVVEMGIFYSQYVKELPYSFFFDFSNFKSYQYLDPNNDQEGELTSLLFSTHDRWGERLEGSIRAALSMGRLRNQNGADQDPAYYNTSLNTRKADILVDAKATLSRSAFLRLSFQWQDEAASRLDRSSYANFTSLDESTTDAAVSAGLHLQPRPWVRALIGVRSDHPSLFASRTSPQVRVALSQPHWHTKVRLGWSRGFRVPTLSDLYYPGFGNPDLKPESGESYDLGLDQGLDFLGPGARVSMVYFHRDVRDLIFYSANVAEARYRGLEVELSGLLGTRGLVRMNYTYTRARRKMGGSEDALPRRPRHSANLFLAYRAYRSLEVASEFAYVGKQTAALDFVTYDGREVKAGDPIAPHSIWNVSVRLGRPRWGGGKVFVKVRNVLDSRYEEVRGYPAPGRNLAAGVEVSF